MIVPVSMKQLYIPFWQLLHCDRTCHWISRLNASKFSCAGCNFSGIFSSNFLAVYIRMLEEAISSSFPDHLISKDNHLIIIHLFSAIVDLNINLYLLESSNTNRINNVLWLVDLLLFDPLNKFRLFSSRFSPLNYFLVIYYRNSIRISFFWLNAPVSCVGRNMLIKIKWWELQAIIALE